MVGKRVNEVEGTAGGVRRSTRHQTNSTSSPSPAKQHSRLNRDDSDEVTEIVLDDADDSSSHLLNISNSEVVSLDDAIIVEDDADILLADNEANEQTAGVPPGTANSSMEGIQLMLDPEENFSFRDDEIVLSEDEEQDPNAADVSLVCLKRPCMVEKRIECFEIYDSDEEFPVCLGEAEKTETVNVEEKQGYVKEYIENEGIALIHSETFGLVIFHLENVWIDGEKRDLANTKSLLPVGSFVYFYDKSFEGPEYKLLCPEEVIQQAVVVWKGSRPKHLMKIVDSFDRAFWNKLKEVRNTFLLYLRGEVFLPVSLVRVKGVVRGYLTDNIGIIEIETEEREKENVFFHCEDVRIYRRPVSHYRTPLTTILPVGVHLSVDARRVHITGVNNLVYQAIMVLAGSWPATPHPTLLPGGQGSYSPMFELPDYVATWYYTELALEGRLKKKVENLKLALGASEGYLRFRWNGVNTVRNREEEGIWRNNFIPHDSRRRNRLPDRSKRQVTHTFKAPPIRRFKTKDEWETASDVATEGGSIASSVSGVGSRVCSSRLSTYSGLSSARGSQCETKTVRTWYNQETWPYGGLRLKTEVKAEDVPWSLDSQGQPSRKRFKSEV